MTHKIAVKRVLMVMLVAFAAAFIGACTTTREPVSMVEPSYSYLRDTAPSSDDFSMSESADATVPLSADDERASNGIPAAGEMMDDQSLLNEQTIPELYEPSGSDYLYEMARLTGQRP